MQAVGTVRTVRTREASLRSIVRVGAIAPVAHERPGHCRGRGAGWTNSRFYRWRSNRPLSGRAGQSLGAKAKATHGESQRWRRQSGRGSLGASGRRRTHQHRQHNTGSTHGTAGRGSSTGPQAHRQATAGHILNSVDKLLKNRDYTSLKVRHVGNQRDHEMLAPPRQGGSRARREGG